MAVVAEGPSDERSSQQEVTLVPHASHRIVSMGMPRWVWSVVGVEMPRRAMCHVVCNLCCACAFHEVKTSERRLHYTDRCALIFGGQHPECSAQILH